MPRIWGFGKRSRKQKEKELKYDESSSTSSDPSEELNRLMIGSGVEGVVSSATSGSDKDSFHTTHGGAGLSAPTSSPPTSPIPLSAYLPPTLLPPLLRTLKRLKPPSSFLQTVALHEVRTAQPSREG